MAFSYCFCVGQPELERGRSPLVSIPPFGAGIFKASRSTDPMRIWKPRKEQVPALPFIVSMSPPGYPSAWLRPRRARFRFARQDPCSSTTSIGLNCRGRDDHCGSPPAQIRTSASTHTALTKDGWRRSVHRDKGAELGVEESTS